MLINDTLASIKSDVTANDVVATNILVNDKLASWYCPMKRTWSYSWLGGKNNRWIYSNPCAVPIKIYTCIWCGSTGRIHNYHTNEIAANASVTLTQDSSSNVYTDPYTMLVAYADPAYAHGPTTNINDYVYNKLKNVMNNVYGKTGNPYQTISYLPSSAVLLGYREGIMGSPTSGTNANAGEVIFE